MYILEKISKLEKEADLFGFRWDNPQQILEQITSECQEVAEQLDANPIVEQNAELQEEISDLIHAAFSLCVFCDFDIEETINISIDKFVKRMFMVRKIAEEKGIDNLTSHSFSERMQFWDAAKERLSAEISNIKTDVSNKPIDKDFDDLVIYPLFDIDKALKSFNQDKALVQDILKSMVEHEIPETLQSIYLAHAEENWDAIADLVHKMKGGAMYCGTTKLQYACTYFEKYNRLFAKHAADGEVQADSTIEDRNNLLDKLLEVCSETQIKIKSWLADKKEFFK